MTRIEPQEQDWDPARWSASAAARHLAEGVRLFNACEYKAAHEEFEHIWLSTEGSDSDFFKGLIQACIALHHFQSGNLEGAAKLYSGHRRYLAPYVPRYHGIDVADFLEAMQRALRPVVRRSAQENPSFDASSRPLLKLAES